MVVFNTLKKAEHYVKYQNQHSKRVRNQNWNHAYMYHYLSYRISGKYVIQQSGGDGCGCGCDMYTWRDLRVIGRIK